MSSDEGDQYSDEEEEEEEEEDPYMFVKPVFVPKHLRQSELAKAEEEKKQQIWEEKKKLLDEAKKVQTKIYVAEAVRINENSQENNDDADSDAGLPDDSDNLLEYEAWKIRELSRIKRETEEREAMIREQEEVKRRRNMTDEERLEEDRQLGRLKENEEKEKPKWKFLQKYYHKGAFYMDVDSTENDADVRLKDYSAPTLEDRVDKEKLPQVLQVKNFGKRGRTKYTHLLDQDTTVQNSKRVDVRPDKRVMDSYLNRMSGMKKV